MVRLPKKNKHVFTPHFCTIRQTKDNLHEGDRPDLCHKQHKRVMAASAFITINVVSQRACDTFFMKLSVIDKSSFFSYKARDESIFGTNCTIRLRWQTLHHTFLLPYGRISSTLISISHTELLTTPLLKQGAPCLTP